ncbi:hypothetical protein [Candidatus Desulforudis audaxviator]|uniref:Uncharacterized protein n=1 Tax=Desulforudis audaxviator (strain MP104C) TaxID=477974 RepID=B1I650_DESAP|nr:hypothetical protein [Candidatus Desulforudis audaxviator]ACA60474.1 hypothetical protein Daud_1983 [Candidatus Desulforudis audaxviator MP104C]AZK60544.1 hypothetical protein Daudx_2013 [Candidatus Desulforudis audaxviator]
MAGQVKERFGEQVEVETVYKGFLMLGGGDLPKPPNIAVDGELLGDQVTLEQLEEAVRRRLGGG